MIIKFGKTSKKLNSTKSVTLTGEKNGTLLEGCSIQNPVIVFDLESFDMTWNYAYIEKFNRYYFITDKIILSENRISVAFNTDYLKTFLDVIENNNMIFNRTPYKNENCNETLFPIKNKVGATTIIETIPMWDANYSYYLVDICNSQGGVNPTTTTFVFTLNELKEVINLIFTPETYGDGLQVTGDILAQTICNPMQYITSCRWSPYPVPYEECSSSTIMFGWNELDVSFTPKVAKAIGNGWSKTIHIPNKPNPLTDTIMCFIPCFGTINIPNEYSGKNAELFFNLDTATGETSLHITIDNNIYTILNSNLTPSYNITAVQNTLNTNPLKALKTGAITLADKALHFLSENNVSYGDTMGRTVEGLQPSLINSLVDRKVSTISSSSGSIADLMHYRDIILYIVSTDLMIENASGLLGYPNYIYNTVSNHGYYKVEYCSLVGEMMIEDKTSLTNILKSGFYYES